jgi:perosamine synthetase
VLPDRPLIPHSRPTVDRRDIRAVSDVLRSAHLAQGEQVRRFEEAVASFLGRRGGVATSSGTSALHLALLVLGVGAGDEVLVPSYSCVALLHAVQYVGAVARPVDIDPETYNLCPRAARRYLTRKTRAVIVPHMFGMPADLEEIVSWGVPVVEDCAQTLGATYRGRQAGAWGVLTVCSFYATKVLTTGEGGMLLSDSDTLLRRARDLRDYDGRATLRVRFNYKMTDMQAALGRSQLRRLHGFLDRRRSLATRYTAALRSLPVRLPQVPPDRTHMFYRYVIGVQDAVALMRRMHERGIECKPPVSGVLHRFLGQDGCPAAEAASRTAVSIPLYPSLSDADADVVAGAIADELEHRPAARRIRAPQREDAAARVAPRTARGSRGREPRLSAVER